MADANKPVRLSKAAREFNLGIGTIVDFLETKGIRLKQSQHQVGPRFYALCAVVISKGIRMLKKQPKDLLLA